MRRLFLLACAWAACNALGAMPAQTPEEALDLALRTYDYVAKAVPAERLARLKRELDADAKWLKNARTDVERRVVEKQIRSVRRRILFSHPDLAFDKILAVQRGIPYSSETGMTDQYTGRFARPGPGLVVLSNWKLAPHKEVLLQGGNRLPEGCVLNPTLHWDAKRVVFAFNNFEAPKPCADPKPLDVPTLFWRGKENPMQRCIYEWIGEMDPTHPVYGKNAPGEAETIHHRYFIWEAATDGSWVRQLTGTKDDPLATADGRQTVPVEDADPCYLPGGKGIVFNSTRTQTFGRCHWGRFNPSFLLYAADADGRNVRPFSFGEANEWSPAVLLDGRIVYTRWDYIHRNAVTTTGLWAVRPDGTGVSHYYGSYDLETYTLAQAKPIPGTRKVVAVGCPHHLYTAGSLVVIDADVAEDGEKGMTRLTPEIEFPEAKRPQADRFRVPGTWTSPMPVNDVLFFASYSDDPLWYPEDHPHRATPGWQAAWQTPRSYGVWLVDTLGGRELIYQDPEFSTFDPMPLVARPEPPAIASLLPPADKAPPTGECYVSDVYDCRHPIPRGSVKALRLNRIIGQPTAAHANMGAIDVKKVSLGTVPVSEDGSCAFRMPAGVPIQLQAVDGDGMAVMTMRSFIYAQKGERQSCTGCHENKYGGVHPARPPKNLVPADPKPETDLGYAGPLSYARSIQPIFDRKCISCHGLGDAPFSLVGAKKAFASLRGRKLLGEAVAYEETQESTPRDYYAAASGLVKKLKSGHGPTLAREEWTRLVLWLDLNVCADDIGGDYSWKRPELREIDAAGEKALREAVRATLGAKVAEQPLDALVNRGDERLSRVLWLVEKADEPRFLALAKGVFKPFTRPDVDGTCDFEDYCRCYSCWVRRGGYNTNVNAQEDGK